MVATYLAMLNEAVTTLYMYMYPQVIPEVFSSSSDATNRKFSNTLYVHVGMVQVQKDRLYIRPWYL